MSQHVGSLIIFATRIKTWHITKKSSQGPLFKLTKSGVAKQFFFEMQGLKLKRGVCAGIFCIFKPKIA
jgi:hypothetical protein